MSRVGATISPAASTSGRCNAIPVCCHDLSVLRLVARPVAFSASKDTRLTLGRRCASGAGIIRCGRVSGKGDKRAPLPLAAIGVNAAGVLEAEIVTDTGSSSEDERRKADAAQAAIAAVRAATQNLQAHFNMGPDGAIGQWDGFTVSCEVILCTIRARFAMHGAVIKGLALWPTWGQLDS